MAKRLTVWVLAGLLGLVGSAVGQDAPMTIGGWQMQDAGKMNVDGAAVSAGRFDAGGWYGATVPGTVLTTLVANHVYPAPLYGENNRPEVIPESLARSSYWYRTVVMVPASYRGRRVWVNFEGINYSSEVWVNGTQVGQTRGAFARGNFDITSLVKAGKTAVVAVLVAPEPHPGVPHEHTLRAGMGKNGGVTASDGPTFLSTIGWDWMPAIRDRDTGIWRKVTLSETGPVRLVDPVVTTKVLSVAGKEAELTVSCAMENATGEPQAGVLRGELEGVRFERAVTVAAHARETVTFNAETTPGLKLHAARLWWPNGYGAQELYKMRLAFDQGGRASDAKEVTFGVRKIEYTVPGVPDALGITVNDVPVFLRGGNWGMDDALKQIPVERLEAQIRMHKLANLNFIRNWVGQSTSEDFYALCDKYGMLVWDEFFQPNPNDGPDPIDTATYLANVKEKVVRFRNHPSIVLWCARNEGNPPADLDAALRVMLGELDPGRLYQANSSDGRGVRSHGPYHWREPKEYFSVRESLKTETGSMSVPTLESVQGMMPQKDWETINDDWAEHDFTRGAGGGDVYPGLLAARYGAIVNLADFVRKAQMANYEAYRAMYEGREAEMFRTTTGVITWMSHPAQPSFVWQLYHYDLEPNASLSAVQLAAEPVHVQYHAVRGVVQVVNETAAALDGAKVYASVLNMDGSVASEQEFAVTAKGSSVVDCGLVALHEPLTKVYFLALRLVDKSGATVSRNFYWLTEDEPDTFKNLEEMPVVRLDTSVAQVEKDGKTLVTVTLTNPSTQVALMAHLQLHKGDGGPRVLPAYASENYVTLRGGESRVVTIEADAALLGGATAVVQVDGWNVDVAPATGVGAAVVLNGNAQVARWPKTGLPGQTVGLR